MMKLSLVFVASLFLLQGCITDVVTIPAKVAVKATEDVVKGTADAVGAVDHEIEHRADGQHD